MSTIPRDKHLDSALPLFGTGYPYIHQQCEHLKSPIFQSRLMGMKIICIHGPEAASVFYDPDKFIRKGAIPKRIQKTLLGEHAVHTLDETAHRHRKEMFMTLMNPSVIKQLTDTIQKFWLEMLPYWEQKGTINLFLEMQHLLCRSACAWAGVPLKEAEARERARDLGNMVDAFGGVGLRHWKGRLARRITERWISSIIEQIRNKEFIPAEGTPAAVVAWHRDLNGNLLDTKTTTVELINMIRPIVAIAYYISFGALALHENPEYHLKLQQNEGIDVEDFVQEVRRLYPFAPFVSALVRNDFEWAGYTFKKGTMVLLDIYGTLHDGQLWEHPDKFMPERFKNRKENKFDLIPQGGGDYLTGHRCAGERITIETIKVAISFLAKHMDYSVPAQDLSVDLSRMPTLPRSGFVMSDVKSRI